MDTKLKENNQGMKLHNEFRVLGLMSGTSLDGLDIAYCHFKLQKRWAFEIVAAQTIPYAVAWKKKLATAHRLQSEDLLELHAAYGNFLGDQCTKFIRQHKIRRVDLIASHGHTVFHQPHRRFTFQLGNGSSLYRVAGIPVVYDFRVQDVALGGEGAPLVPVGDKMLFSSYDVCLNLGGIANLSMEVKGERRAFDICFCNMMLNFLMRDSKKGFDEGGRKSADGKVNAALLDSLSGVYAALRKKRPSIGREMFEEALQPMLTVPGLCVEDKLRTGCESIADEIVRAIPRSTGKIKLMATGGGAHNVFLISLLRKKLGEKVDVIVPPRDILEFKEALVFAFLGILRVRNEINVLSSVTHAERDSCSGALIGAI